MGTQYLMDSNAVIDYLKGSLPATGMKFMNNVINDVPHVSIITEIEVLGFNTTLAAYTLLTDFFNDASVFNLTKDVANRTIDLRKKYKIKLPDAIIAATAITYKRTLITRNISDFKQITELNCVDAHAM